MSDNRFNIVLKLRLAAAACLLVAILVTFLMALPNRSSKAQTEEMIVTSQGATAALEVRLESYLSSGLTAVEFESSVASLDAAIPFSGVYPRCEDGSDPLGLAAANLNQNNIKFALDEAMKSAGIASEVTDYTKTEVAVTESNSLSAYAVSVAIPSSPDQLDEVMKKLTEEGFLVTSDTVVVTAEQTETITSTSMTTSARLIFWYSSTPEFYQAEALEAACNATSPSE